MRDMKIKGTNVLVTGANRGLGRAIVDSVLAAGARRVYAGARDPKTLAPLVERAAGVVVPLRVDITDDASLAEAAKSAPDVEVLVNNAGVLASFNALTSAADTVSLDFATNFFGLLAATKAFLPALERAPGRAAVVNVLSVVSFANMPALGTYSASKAAAYSLTQALRAELGKKGIRVHAAFPGAIDTDMVKSFDMAKTSPADVARGIIEGVERGDDEILPDPMSRELVAMWKRDPRALEQQLATMSGM
jgi:NAD(P)-dependent dehydrogenase (short-subunit alcohol dehydrogenase family)